MHALIQRQLQAQQLKGLYRERTIRPKGLCFASNDYLGLAEDKAVMAALCEGVYLYGLGATGSALITGYSRAHAKLEGLFAEYMNRDRALLFSNGYMANAAVLQALLGPEDVVLQDKQNHASLLDGAKLAGAGLKRYQHLNLAHLKELIGQTKARSTMIATDHVFSMSGEIAPIADLVQISQRAKLPLMVDHAHGLGVVSFPYTQQEVPLLVCPLGKAMGGSGALVTGSTDFIEALIQFARPYMFSTALSPAMAHALITALKLMQTEPWRREKLLANIHYFKEGAKARGILINPSDTGIQMLVIGDQTKAQNISDHLFKKRLFVRAIRPPSVPVGQAGLRITLSAKHERAEIDFLLDHLQRYHEF